jgi:iron complex outermembrane receptor protein
MKQLLLILTLIFSAGLTAQEIKVSGVVTDTQTAFTRHIDFS